ncbi:Ribosomal RNA small subunit methyltransferase B [Pseudoruegeria aquimaris]|uniref:Ribosomal RNA small subunit methyltransferase B n=1 Tax=Pseudoruegeria aquimaris TaxID=393663 RepID=A0A1Y5RAU6_9RHOB|nr:RsmB/NOP family class I SAM-dependent RNA methyltransferase [Pseudoruegeria aquimaris]SLN10431.1 Ribosomal RNA small subunit methyltransferase B [Pseudoruegeria aquimaris]
MTPAARVAAAIGILDEIFAGAPAERALTRWARGSRFAGSKDRAAVRDHVFDALRCRSSFGWLGGGETGRAVMIGALRSQGLAPETLFTGEGHAPAPLSAAERAALPDPSEMPRAVARDLPEWIWPLVQQAHGAAADGIAEALRHRAPVFLRVNTRKQGIEAARENLLADNIETRPHPLAQAALEVTANARRVQASAAYRDGLVELQDVGSQALVEALPLPEGGRILDYCAGGGGKSLAMAARVTAEFVAHDASAARMKDLPERAARAGVEIRRATGAELRAGRPFDLVLADVPCSGTGAWRRSPDSKWRFDANALQDLVDVQAGILRSCRDLVSPGGGLAYATCSLLDQENRQQIERFLSENADWHEEKRLSLTPLDGGDGFFLSVLRRKTE